jgi:hypothetical protein
MKPPALLDSLILAIRGQKVLLDADLAAIYGVPTKRLIEQVKRNADRFPVDFVFRLSPPDLADLQSQIATTSSEAVSLDFWFPIFAEAGCGAPIL